MMAFVFSVINGDISPMISVEIDTTSNIRDYDNKMHWTHVLNTDEMIANQSI